MTRWRRPLSFLGLALVAGVALAKMAVVRLPFDEYADALTAIESWAPEPIPAEKFIYSSIHGMLARLDPHTSFLEPDDYADLREKQQGSYYGIGLVIQNRAGKTVVITAMDGTPAFRMGVRAGDVLTRIGGEEIREDTSTDEISARLRGSLGTSVRVTLRRPGMADPIHLVIPRAEIPTLSVPYAFMLNADTGYILLRDFTQTSGREVTAALEKLQKLGMKKLVFDLRGNPGGVLDQAVNVADVFLSRGERVVYTRGRTPSSAQDFYAPGEGAHFDRPLVVLINRGSASASEIVAGAIQDHDRGLILGQRSWGKGLVQSVYTLPYGAGLALTTARYYTPSGRWIQRDYSDLLAYVNPEDPDAGTVGDAAAAAEAPRQAGQTFYTEAGRTVYAAGGITPDVMVKSAWGDSKLLSQLLARQLFFNFAVDYLARHPEVKADVAVTEGMREEFFRFAEKSKFSTAEELSRQWQEDANRRLVDLAMQTELVNAKFGLEAGRKVQASGDAQLQKALAEFDEAARIAALPKKPSPARAARQGS
ncbi:MAG: S41 family peptidase [Acidobacteriota bacterium]